MEIVRKLSKMHFDMQMNKCVQDQLWLYDIYRSVGSGLFYVVAYSMREARIMCSVWWRHQMETFSALLAICAGNSPVTGEFPAKRPVTQSFDVFFDLRLNKRLNKQSWGWWFETPSCHCDVTLMVTNDRLQFDTAEPVLWINATPSRLTTPFISFYVKCLRHGGACIYASMNQVNSVSLQRIVLRIHIGYMCSDSDQVMDWIEIDIPLWCHIASDNLIDIGSDKKKCFYLMVPCHYVNQC